MRTLVRRLAAVCCFVLVGCYHANIETGRAAGSQRIEKEWASSFVFGLVPPEPITAQQTLQTCTDGVSKVETQLSFLNGLVGGLTLGIYTPMDITVTCAAPGAATGGATK